MNVIKITNYVKIDLKMCYFEKITSFQVDIRGTVVDKQIEN